VAVRIVFVYETGNRVLGQCGYNAGGGDKPPDYRIAGALNSDILVAAVLFEAGVMSVEEPGNQDVAPGAARRCAFLQHVQEMAGEGMK
jgi:hypothetical protein